jgi:hypothetical protein
MWGVHVQTTQLDLNAGTAQVSAVVNVSSPAGQADVTVAYVVLDPQGETAATSEQVRIGLVSMAWFRRTWRGCFTRLLVPLEGQCQPTWSSDSNTSNQQRGSLVHSHSKHLHHAGKQVSVVLQNLRSRYYLRSFVTNVRSIFNGCAGDFNLCCRRNDHQHYIWAAQHWILSGAWFPSQRPAYLDVRWMRPP